MLSFAQSQGNAYHLQQPAHVKKPDVEKETIVATKYASQILKLAQAVKSQPTKQYFPDAPTERVVVLTGGRVKLFVQTKHALNSLALMEVHAEIQDSAVNAQEFARPMVQFALALLAQNVEQESLAAKEFAKVNPVHVTQTVIAMGITAAMENVSPKLKSVLAAIYQYYHKIQDVQEAIFAAKIFKTRAVLTV